jgi:hypothetical protein
LKTERKLAWTEGVAQLEEDLPSKPKDLSSNPNTKKRKERKST